MNLNPTKDDVYGVLKHYNFEIVDGIVNVRTHVDLRYLALKELPFRFGHIDGEFDCSHNLLSSLDGAPKTVWRSKNGYMGSML